MPIGEESGSFGKFHGINGSCSNLQAKNPWKKEEWEEFNLLATEPDSRLENHVTSCYSEDRSKGSLDTFQDIIHPALNEESCSQTMPATPE